MIEEVREILNNKAEEVIKSPQLSLSLLKCYSLLYLSGKPPRVCERMQHKYYLQLQKDGIMKADIVEKAKNRTCKPAWSGLKYVPSFGHINSELVYDEQAVRCLNEKHLRESDFEVLPEGYNKVKEVQKKKRKSNK